MNCFLTSSPCLPGEIELCYDNGFRTALLSALPHPCRCLYIASDPGDMDQTAFYAGEMRAIMERSGLRFSPFTILDDRNSAQTAPLVADAEFIVLAGGHVPTQNAFFERIGLRDIIHGFDGVVMGISAGTMNAADTVYAHPERPGEALMPKASRFQRGLGLTHAMVLPHFQENRYEVLDGLRVLEDVAFPDSMGRTFHALVDGSWIHVQDGQSVLYGEAYVIRDGGMEQILKIGESLHLQPGVE